MTTTMKRPKMLICACCGSTAIGRQWWNRDTGYGLCKHCISFVSERQDPEEVRQSYGVRGVHYDIPAEEAGELAQRERQPD